VDTLSYKTVSANNQTVDKKWVLIDAQDQTLGRMSAVIAKLLRGKYKPEFTPHVDCGDNVIVINADKVRLTGLKLQQKEYVHYTGYPGGQRTIIAKDLQRKHPERLVTFAVKGMIPKNRLRGTIMKNLRVYCGTEHPHEAQNPRVIDLKTIK